MLGLSDTTKIFKRKGGGGSWFNSSLIYLKRQPKYGSFSVTETTSIPGS